MKSVFTFSAVAICFAVAPNTCFALWDVVILTKEDAKQLGMEVRTTAGRAKSVHVALECGLPIGGWVPKGRGAEDGRIPERYTGLREAESSDPAVRTRLNVRDSDATLIVSHGPLAGGSSLTMEEARRAGKPVLHVDLSRRRLDEAAVDVGEWIAAVAPATLNVAGPRASGDPAIGGAVAALLRAVLRRAPGGE